VRAARLLVAMTLTCVVVSAPMALVFNEARSLVSSAPIWSVVSAVS